ncbi:hypothetical protein LUZ60_003204 [Juncus effusus]|nr:hypothetical protein LUZ60_003204 [Juncus effusus]
MGVNHHYSQNGNSQASNFHARRIVKWALFFLIPIALVHYLVSPVSSNQAPIISQNKHKSNPQNHSKPKTEFCDYSNGAWIQSSLDPLYNGTSCGTIKKGQNCMVHGRPDTGYLYWRWKPVQCEVLPFSPSSFLELIRNRHVAFVGDSMARNQLESLLCLLASKSRPELVYNENEENKFRRWIFRDYNATVSVFWSPFLVKGVEKSAVSGLNHNKLYLDSADEKWASKLDEFDVMIFSIGHWFLHPAIYYEGNKILGCHALPEFNHTEIGFFDVFRKAIKTTLKEVKKRVQNSDKLVVVTTFSPAHFEGEWDKAGACSRKEPYKNGEREMEYMDKEMNKIEIEEVRNALKEMRGRLKIEALDVTKMAFMRPDGHPGPYMNPNPFKNGLTDRVQNDCVHWCMPGPIDSWNEILLQMIAK